MFGENKLPKLVNASLAYHQSVTKYNRKYDPCQVFFYFLIKTKLYVIKAIIT